MNDKITKIPIDELVKIADKLEQSERVADSNEALLLHHLIVTLRGNAELTELVANLGLAVDSLRRNESIAATALIALEREHSALRHFVFEESARIDVLSSTIETVFGQLSEITKRAEEEGNKLEALAGSVADQTEP